MVISLVAVTTPFATVLAPATATAAPAVSSTTVSTASAARVAGATVGDRASHRITQAGRWDGRRLVSSTSYAVMPYQLRERSYVFYADDAPHTLYQHRGRIVIVALEAVR